MLLHFDLDLRAFVTLPGTSDRLTALTLKRGDTTNFLVKFYSALTVQELDSGATGKIALKEVGIYDGDPLATATSWVKTGTGEDTVYTFSLSTNTEEINDLLGVGAPADIASVNVNFEMEYTELGSIISSQTILTTIFNDVNRPEDLSPDPAATPDAYWVAHGHAQTLTELQKTQAQENIGLPAVILALKTAPYWVEVVLTPSKVNIATGTKIAMLTHMEAGTITGFKTVCDPANEPSTIAVQVDMNSIDLSTGAATSRLSTVASIATGANISTGGAISGTQTVTVGAQSSFDIDQGSDGKELRALIQITPS